MHILLLHYLEQEAPENKYISFPISTALVQVFNPEYCNSLKQKHIKTHCHMESGKVFTRIYGPAGFILRMQE